MFEVIYLFIYIIYARKRYDYKPLIRARKAKIPIELRV